jgi:hypothetical protein
VGSGSYTSPHITQFFDRLRRTPMVVSLQRDQFSGPFHYPQEPTIRRATITWEDGHQEVAPIDVRCWTQQVKPCAVLARTQTSRGHYVVWIWSTAIEPLDPVPGSQ